MAGQSPTDDQLMAGMQAGDATAFKVLYDRFDRRAFGLALSFCRDRIQAEEAVQDAFLAVWRSRALYQPDRGPVAAWLLTIVRHRAIDVVRRSAGHAHRRADEQLPEQVASTGDPAERAGAQDDACRLHGLLARMPVAQREVVALAYFGQLTHSEIAARLGVPAGTVKGRMRLALGKLRAELESAT